MTQRAGAQRPFSLDNRRAATKISQNVSLACFGSHCVASGFTDREVPDMNVVVDDRAVEVPAGATVLDAVNRLGLPLPQLCKDPDRAPLGACRTCLVHVDGVRGTPAACHLPARDGRTVSTTHPEAVRVRALVLDLTRSMLTDGDGRNGFGQLGPATARHSVVEPRWPALHHFDRDESKSFFLLDREACILCGRCTTA